MLKEVKLVQNVKNGEQIIATFQTFLRGDGATPSITTVGGYNTIIGYNDDGSAIISHDNDSLIEMERQKFRAEAIKEQKRLCVENGVDPDLVNILNAEKKVNVNE